jgi:hypothetical protein
LEAPWGGGMDCQSRARQQQRRAGVKPIGNKEQSAFHQNHGKLKRQALQPAFFLWSMSLKNQGGDRPSHGLIFPISGTRAIA